MMLGKRARHVMKRTASMTEFTLDHADDTTGAGHESQPRDVFGNPFIMNNNNNINQKKPGVVMGYDGITVTDQRFLNNTVSPRNNHRRNSIHFVGTGDFLRACSRCKRRLVPGRDIYMYRGDTAFCSLECRQQQIVQDDRNEKCSLASKKATPYPIVAGPETQTIDAAV